MAHRRFGGGDRRPAGDGPIRRTRTHVIELSVEERGRLRRLPEQLVPAHGSSLRMTTQVELAPTAGLVLRDEQMLGRDGERSWAGTVLSVNFCSSTRRSTTNAPKCACWERPPSSPRSPDRPCW